MNSSLETLFEVESSLKLSQFYTNSTTEGPEIENGMPSPEDIDVIFEDSLRSSSELEELVTETPGEVVTVQYFLEGEAISATLGSTLHDLLSSPSTSNPLSGLTDMEDDIKSASVPILFTCYNKTHHLTLTGQNRSLFISEIVRRYSSYNLDVLN